MSRTPIRGYVRRPRECPHITAHALAIPAPPFVIPAKAGIQRGGDGKCSAVEDYARRGACPPLGSGGVAELTVRIRCTYPQLQLFVPSCAGGDRHGRLL